ncbi:MAG: hypothetical protein GXP08_11475 [Gammaproteobacteria bacterium]|nr:hypothetical protein [Gammaproteobacteria bacterium]
MDKSTTAYCYAVPVQGYTNTRSGQEFGFRDFWRVLVDFKWFIVVVVFIFGTVSVMVALSITPVYRAEVLLAPATGDNNRQGGIAALAGQFGGLAGLTGISVGGGSDIEMAIATLKSRKFITSFIADFELKPILFESQWDTEKNQWIVEKPSLWHKFKNIIISRPKKILTSNLAPGEPSPGKAYNTFRGGMLSVLQNKRTQLVTVSIEWKNPQQSAEWANALVKRLNEELRQNKIDEAGRSIAYLTEQINQTSLSELQNVLYRIIEEHTKIITLAKVNDEYVMKVIDPAVPPEISAKPNGKFIVILGLFLGVILGIFSAFLLKTIRNWQEAETQSEK